MFVMGMQRSGTTIVARALSECALVGFNEGNVWHMVVETLRRMRDPMVFQNYKDINHALGGDRLSSFERSIALAIDDFHRYHLSCPTEARWFDKSPSAYIIENAAMLADLFPEAQFVFVHRHPVAVVESGLRMWGQSSELFKDLCRGWAETMRCWREIREGLGNRAFEIAHAELVSDPEGVARDLTAFIGCPDRHKDVLMLFGNERCNTSFPEKEKGDYRLWVDMNQARRRELVSICSSEMHRWGYSVPFDSVGRFIGGMSIDGPATTRSLRSRARKAGLLLQSGDWRKIGMEVRGFSRWIMKGRSEQRRGVAPPQVPRGGGPA